MDKPITIRYEEFKNELEELINDSRLPPFIIEIVMQEYLNEVHGCAVAQYQKDKSIYENRMNEGDSNDSWDVEWEWIWQEVKKDTGIQQAKRNEENFKRRKTKM